MSTLKHDGSVMCFAASGPDKLAIIIPTIKSIEQREHEKNVWPSVKNKTKKQIIKAEAKPQAHLKI